VARLTNTDALSGVLFLGKNAGKLQDTEAASELE
jgi:hypothetical protein